MPVVGSIRSWRTLLLTGFTVVITMLLAQPAAADELVPGNDDGVHFWDSSGFRDWQPGLHAGEVHRPPPCQPPDKRCAGTARPAPAPPSVVKLT